MVTLTFENLTRRFGTQTAVNHINLTIPQGQLFFLLGPSGCGKTTLLRMIAGFVAPSEGNILFNGQNVTRVPAYKRDTAMVFQSYALWPHMSVFNNVAFGLKVRKISREERRRRVGAALEMVQMSHLGDRKPAQLSGGQQQRVALARALAVRPRCLLLDEPLSNLDAKLRMEMRAEIRRIVKSIGATAVYVTHDQKEALAMADGIALLNAGKLEQAGTPLEIYQHPVSRFAAEFIGQAAFLSGTVAERTGIDLKLETAVGTLTAKANGRWLKMHDAVTIALRPEAVRVVASVSSPGINRFAAKLVGTTYLGEIAEHRLELSDGQLIKAFELNPKKLPESGSCTIEIEPEDVIILKDVAHS